MGIPLEDAMMQRAVFGLFAISCASLHAGTLEVRNDGFDPVDGAAFQGGFGEGEIAAASLVTPCAPASLNAVRLLYGGADATRTVTIVIYDDTAATTLPGAPLGGSDFQLTGNNTALSEIDLTGEAITLPARFRVGVQFQDTGLPSIGRDLDGTIDDAKNFVRVNDGGSGQWVRSDDIGIHTDWIIRAVVDCTNDNIFKNGFEAG